MKSLVKNWVKRIPPIRGLVEQRDELLRKVRNYDYDHDSLRVWGKNVAFLHEPRFVKAYATGMDSGHKIGRKPGSKEDIHIEWRVHLCCWAASHAKHLAGDFVECGVNTGILSLAVCNYIDFNSTGKRFYLFDTFCGIPVDQMPHVDLEDRVKSSQELYEECYEVARQNFAGFPAAKLVRGRIPDTLDSVSINQVCYLSIDMNIVIPEIAAIKFFWDKLVSGAPVILDDYGWIRYADQKEAMDDFAASQGVKIATLPTGQGFLLKP